MPVLADWFNSQVTDNAAGHEPVHVTIDVYNPEGKLIEVDATMSEDHDYDAEVSEYPIESGADVVDNVRIKPLSIKLDCIISATPLREELKTDNMAYRQYDAYYALVRLFHAKQPVAIRTSLSLYENMVINNLSFPRSAENGEALKFTISFQQVQIIENKRETVKVSLGNLGAKVKPPGPYLLVWTFPPSRRDEPAVSRRYQLILTDSVSVTGETNQGKWDHYSFRGAGADPAIASPTHGNAFVDQAYKSSEEAAADGFVTLGDMKYHPYAAKRSATLTSLFSDKSFDKSIGAHFDKQSGQWLDANGRPVTASPDVAYGPNPASQVWQTVMKGAGK